MASRYSEGPFPWREYLPGVLYGLLGGVCMILADRAFPWGWAVFWTLLLVQMVVGTWVVWRRLRLKFYAIGGLAGILFAGTAALYALNGYRFTDVIAREPLPIVVALIGAIILVPLSTGIEAHLKTDAWQAWKVQSERASVWDMLTFRDIPDLSNRRAD